MLAQDGLLDYSDSVDPSGGEYRELMTLFAREGSLDKTLVEVENAACFAVIEVRTTE